MRKAMGEPLYTLDRGTYEVSFPLLEIIGRVTLGMSQARHHGIVPMVEHAGNVMVRIAQHGITLGLIDIDACRPWRDGRRSNVGAT